MYCMYLMDLYWRRSSGSRTKGTVPFGLLGIKKTAVWSFFPSFEQYQSEYHCFSKCFALFLFGGTRLATWAVSDVWVGHVSGLGRGKVHWVPLCCGPLGYRRHHFLLHSPQFGASEQHLSVRLVSPVPYMTPACRCPALPTPPLTSLTQRSL